MIDTCPYASLALVYFVIPNPEVWSHAAAEAKRPTPSPNQVTDAYRKYATDPFAKTNETMSGTFFFATWGTAKAVWLLDVAQNTHVQSLALVSCRNAFESNRCFQWVRQKRRGRQIEPRLRRSSRDVFSLSGAVGRYEPSQSQRHAIKQHREQGRRLGPAAQPDLRAPVLSPGARCHEHPRTKN